MFSSASKSLLLGLCAIVAAGADAAEPGHFGYGERATPAQIAGWDIDVRGDDGAGLPRAKAASTAARRSLPTNAPPVMELSARAKAAFPSWRAEPER